VKTESEIRNLLSELCKRLKRANDAADLFDVMQANCQISLLQWVLGIGGDAE